MLALSILAAVVALGAITLGNSLKIVKQYERGVVFRLGRVNSEPRPPGMTAIVPFVDKLEKVNLQIVTMPIPAQEGITRDNVTVRVDAVTYFKVVDPCKAVIDVEDYQLAVGQVAQTSLRSIIGQSELDDLLTNRERLNQGLASMIDSPAVDWGVHIDRVEIKDVALPETMKRSMSRQAEAERERRSRVIIADGELQASNKLAQASEAMAHTPAAPPTTEAGAKSTTEAGVTPTTDTPAEAADQSESDTKSNVPADLEAIVQAMSESLKLTGLMPEQERVTSDMPEQERTTSDSAARSDTADQEEHFGHA
ncbi:slipin family protein [Brevibacterium linens]|uniref:Regulator of protease activity HflC, stomatin/prohibitin superfamily n=1 Tax=Brevibacterium linens ATCC 9172 TaxID=1255617 RepID=A0A2H1J644_BRELN|nr:slipin family protein [Brevibacterium linens]KAB1948651.1 slipin family protein [Brevibacterium linens ATCC 9172]SMX82950.1 Regulator of protease activity HflC, stomatin/prohibitin superfamily [Brevibacterium linens ATCC 9172]